MPNIRPRTTTQATLDSKLLAAQKCLVNYSFLIGDLVLVDLEMYRPVLREELQTKCKWSPFEGWNLTGFPVVTIVGGQVVFDHGTINSNVRGKALSFDA